MCKQTGILWCSECGMREDVFVKGQWDRHDICSILLKYKHLPPWTSQSQFRPFCATITPTNRVCTCLGGGLNGLMNKNLDVITHAVTLIIKAAIMAARFSGRVRKRSLKSLKTSNIEAQLFHFD